MVAPISASASYLRETWQKIVQLADPNIHPDSPIRGEWVELTTSFSTALYSLVPDPRSREAKYRESFLQRIWLRPDGHVVWQGMGKDRADGIPVCDWIVKGKVVRTTAAKVMWTLDKGSFPPEGRYLRKRCDVPRCVASACHTLTTDRAGRPPAMRRGEHGEPVCKYGHPLHREFRPGEKVRCKTCDAQMRRYYREHMAAQQSADIDKMRRDTPPPVFRDTSAPAPALCQHGNVPGNCEPCWAQANPDEANGWDDDDEPVQGPRLVPIPPDERTPEEVEEDERWKREQMARIEANQRRWPAKLPEDVAAMFEPHEAPRDE